jgi:hypothetical protein
VGRLRIACAALVLAAALTAAAGAAPGGPDGGPFIQTPVNDLLPWHDAVLDDHDKLLAWYDPDRHGGYDHVLRLGWRFVERGVPVDRPTGLKVYLLYTVFDARSLRGIYWQHNPAALYASFVDSLVAWYPYSGDRRAIAVVKTMLDYQLAHGTTPRDWAWAGVPFATSCAGVPEYGGCLAGMPPTFDSGIEPDKVGLLGLGYLRFYELTQDERYLAAAIACATTLAAHVRVGGVEETPWPFRVDGETGATIGDAEFGGMVVGPVRLLAELARLGLGHPQAYADARDKAWAWMLDHQLNERSASWNRWTAFYEDVRYNPESVNQASPTMTAQYLLTRPRPGLIDPQWLRDSRAAVAWVRKTFARGPFRGALGIDEQKAPGRPGCCSRAGLGSTTSRWGAATALLFARTGDPTARERAFRSLNYATYFAGSDGRISCCGRRSTNTYWFSDGYSDYLRSFNWGMAAIPELAPRGRDHLLGSSSVVRSIAYRRRAISYTTFDDHAVDVLRLSFVPTTVLAGGKKLSQRPDLGDEGYVVERVAGDAVVHVRHDGARQVRIVG